MLLACTGILAAETPKAAAAPAAPQQAAERYFAAIVSDKTPDPAPMMVSRLHMTPEQVAQHARDIGAQLKDKKMKPDVLVVGKSMARVIGTEVSYSDGSKSVVYLDMENENGGWLISEVNCLVATERENIIQGFKELKDPKAQVTKAK